MAASPFLYLLTVLIWGTSWFAIKFQLGVVAPEVSLVYRFGLAAVVLLLFCRLTARPINFALRDHGFVALQAICLFSTNYLVFYHATGLLTSGLVAVVFSLVIFMNMFNQALFLKRRVEPVVLLGAVFGLVGISLVFWPELTATENSAAVQKGFWLSVVATYLASVGNIASARNQQAGLPVLQTNALGMAYGALVMLAYALAAGSRFTYDWSWHYSASLLYLAVFGSIVAFGAYLTLIGRIGADRAAYATVIFPIVALVISSWFEDFDWSPAALSGVGFVLVGNLLVTRRLHRKKRRVAR
ncbi:MAG: DMT family transporter [Gammaproteobacteria bacterium]|nr:DMT family transporter [Gammaproteobacteria bacterium]